MIFCYSPDTTVISYSTMFANDGLGFMLINTSSQSKVVELSSNYYKSDYYWHELYADDEIGWFFSEVKKIQEALNEFRLR